MAGNAPIRLLIFGDSWASAEYGDIDTWPELLAERHCHGHVLNLAQPYAGSDNLDWQIKRLKMLLLARTQVGEEEVLHPEALAIIHSGTTKKRALTAMTKKRALAGCAPISRARAGAPRMMPLVAPDKL